MYSLVSRMYVMLHKTMNRVYVPWTITWPCLHKAVHLVCMNSPDKGFQHSPTWLQTGRSEQYFESSTAFHRGNIWTVFAEPLELFSFGYLWGVLHRSAVRFFYTSVLLGCSKMELKWRLGFWLPHSTWVLDFLSLALREKLHFPSEWLPKSIGVLTW